MALPCIADDWDTAPILTKRAVSRKRPTNPHFLSQCLGAWPATVASPAISPPWVCSTAEASSLDDFDVSSSPGAGTAQDPPYLSTDTPFSISLNQPIPSVCAARCSRLWPVVDLTDCQSRASRCSSTFSAGRDTTSSAVGLQNSISGKAKKQERDVQNASVNTALGTAEHFLDTFDCRHCEKTFATRSTLRHHEILHDPVRAHKYHCTTCQRGFRYPKDLKRHSSTHRQVNEPGEYACPLCHKTFSRRDNLRRHQKLNSHSQPSKPAGAIDSLDGLEGLWHAKRGHTGPVEKPAYGCDQEHQFRSNAASNATSTVPATDSHMTLPIQTGSEKSSTKRPRKSSSDDEEDSNGDGSRRKMARKPAKPGLSLRCPFIGCPAECKGGISVLLRHLKKLHWVDICKYCLKQTPLHQELGCQKICASPACPHKTGKYHVSRGNCADQRHDEVTRIKYGLVCEALGLAEKSCVSDSEQSCPGCQARDEANAILNLDSQAKEVTIAKLTSDCQAKEETIKTLLDIINQLTGPLQMSPLQPNVAGQSGSMSGANAQPILPGGHQLYIYDPELPDLISEPLQSPFTAPSNDARQATRSGSFTHPSLQVTTPTYLSQRETQTETSEALPDSGIDITPKPSDIVMNGYYYPPLCNGDSAVYQTGSQFNGSGFDGV